MNPTSENNSDQPTHEAQRVVIPFDIDTTEVERKLEELERRMKAITSPSGNATQPPVQQTVNVPQPPVQQTVNVPQPPVNLGDSRPTGQPNAQVRDDQNAVRDRQAVLVSLGIMQNYLRQINDTIQLIYSENPNGNR